MSLPKTPYGMHCLLNDLAIALDDVWVGGESWDIKPETIEAYKECVDIIQQDWTRFDRDDLSTLPEVYSNLPYKVEEAL